MSQKETTTKYQELAQEQRQIKSRLQRVEDLLNQFTGKELFEDLSDWGEKFAEKKGITKQQVLKGD